MEWVEVAISTVRGWFKEADWIANAIGILSAIGAIFLIAKKKASTLLGSSTFLDVARIKIDPKWGSLAVKSITEIAIVDDNPDDFPVAELRKAEYRIRIFKEIGLNDILRLSRFDVVFLDIHGIVKDDVEAGGLKIIAQLRNLNPNQKICAVSQKTFDPTATSFFKQADEVQKKPMTSQKCGETIDTLSREKLNPIHLAAILDAGTLSLTWWNRKRLIAALGRFSSSATSVENFTEFEKYIPHPANALRVACVDFIRVLRHVGG